MPTVSGTYFFYSEVDDGIQVIINQQVIFDNLTPLSNGQTNLLETTSGVVLSANTYYPI